MQTGAFIERLSGLSKNIEISRAATAKSEARLEILRTFPTINQTARAIASSIGKNSSNAPAPVATPLPPGNLR